MEPAGSEVREKRPGTSRKFKDSPSRLKSIIPIMHFPLDFPNKLVDCEIIWGFFDAEFKKKIWFVCANELFDFEIQVLLRDFSREKTLYIHDYIRPS